MNQTDGAVPAELRDPSAPIPWANVGWVLGLLVLAYLPILTRMVQQWSTDDDMGHGFFVPAISAYIAWQRKDELLSLEARPSYWGLALLVWSVIQMSLGILGAELFLQRSAFVGSVWGAVLFLGGWAFVRALALPLVMLPLMVPIPAVIYNQITFPLQMFASNVAERALDLLGVPVYREGNILELPSGPLFFASKSYAFLRAICSIRQSLSYLISLYAKDLQMVTL